MKKISKKGSARAGSIIPYIKELNKITGSVEGAIFLKQLMYWDDKSNGEFYKFLEPCNHALYKPGDSWAEELGISAKIIRRSIKKIGFKRGMGVKKQIKKENALFDYYTNNDRMTFYVLNRSRTENIISKTYKQSDKELRAKQNDHVFKQKDNLTYSKEFTKYIETFNQLFGTNHGKTEGNFRNFIKRIKDGCSLDLLIKTLNKMSKSEEYVDSDFMKPGYILSNEDIVDEILYS